MNKRIIIVTLSFPYNIGEEFLETEISYYNDQLDVTILPLRSHAKCRHLPDGIKLDNYMAHKRNNIFQKAYYLVKAMFNPIFYKELISQVKVNLKRVKPFLYSMYLYQTYYDFFNKYLRNLKNFDNTVIYTYWNNEVTYALQSLKKRYNFKLVSRIHGFDLYEERRYNSYMPLKRLFTKNIDRVFTVTESAINYLRKTYGFKYDILEVSRIGVNDYNIICKPSKSDMFIIVSCSFLVNVKRVDKIIDAISILSKKFPLITFKWNHIGSGPLESKLKQYANEKLYDIKNVEYNFLGYLENKEVYDFYNNNPVDVFVNVSESEGVPVSIMEAMSCHIPIIAPNVGGVSDMIEHEKSGILLSEKCDVSELVNGLSNFEFFKNEETRKNAYRIYLEKYDAKKNYTKLIENLKSL